MNQRIVIYWSRRDFRMLDNPALYNAVNFAKEQGLEFLPIYILDKDILHTPGINIGSNRKKILAYLLEQFTSNFKNFGIFCGKPVHTLATLSGHFQIDLFFNDDIEPYSLKRDSEVANLISKNGGKTHVFKDQLTIDKNLVSQSGNQYTVFTPFKNASLQSFLQAKTYPQVEIDGVPYLKNADLNISGLEQVDSKKANLSVEILKIISSSNDSKLFFANHSLELRELISKAQINHYLTTETQVLDRLEDFMTNKVSQYKISRDDLGLDTTSTRSTSQMSMALKWGQVSPRTIKDSILKHFTIDQVLTDQSVSSYLSEIMWREFYKYILFHFPESLNVEFQAKFRNNIQWAPESVALERFKAWVYGKTGYKLVDAAMHQIQVEGWMHNRSRMVVASVLTKNLGVDWRWGQEYFRLMLVDLDESSNNGGWQWGASVGADPKPIRIFNPYIQMEKFDPENKYTNKWLPDSYNVPQPIIDHSKARQEALFRYNLTKNMAEGSLF